MSPRTILGALLAAVALACGGNAPPRPVEVAVIPPNAPSAPLPSSTSADAEPAPPPSAPAPPSEPGESCGLRATLRELPPKDGFARYTLTLTNGGTKPVALVLPGDGSEAGWRTPTLTWIATANGKPATRAEGGRCGMMNAIAASEIFTLAPGATREITDWLGFPSFVPGTYELRLRYRNDPSLQARKTSVAPDVAQKIAQSGACDVTSNAIKTTLKRP